MDPGGVTSLRHWHENEDEFVLIFSGTVVLINDQGECKLQSGDCVPFNGGEPNGHQFVNRSDGPAIIFEIGSRCRMETVHYSDVDMIAESVGDEVTFLKRNGDPILNEV